MRTYQAQKPFVGFFACIFMLLAILLPTPTSANSQATEKIVSKPLVILIEFNDYAFDDIEERENWRIRQIQGSEFPRKIEEVLFSPNVYEEGGHSYISVRSYFTQMSNGTYDFHGKVVGPYKAEHDAAYYGNNDWSGGDQEGARFLIEEAINAAAQDPNIDFSEFDVETHVRDRDTNETKVTYQQPDGQVDNIIVIHPGIGEEFGGGSLGSDAIWPFRRGFTWYGGEYGLKEYVTEDNTGQEWRFDDFTVVAQDAAPDLLIHEFGHILGLPDLYGNNPPVHYWDIMGGSYTGKHIYGTMPVAFGAYSRFFLQETFEEGGATEVEWTKNKTVDFSTIGPHGVELYLHQAHDRSTDLLDAVKIELPTDQYYLLEWRNSVANKVDEGLAHINPYWPSIQYDPGLIIWYINEKYIDEWNRPDQHTAAHPGELFAGVVDADQSPIVHYQNGEKISDNRVDFLMHDAAFSLRNQQEFTHTWGEDFYTVDEHLTMVPYFDDSRDYSNKETNPQAGLILDNHGLKILVLEENADRSTSKIRIMNRNIENNSADYSKGLSIKNIDIVGDQISVFAKNTEESSGLSAEATITFIAENEHGDSVERTIELLWEHSAYKGILEDAENYGISHLILEDQLGNIRSIYNADLHSGYGVSFNDLQSELPDIEEPETEEPEPEIPETEEPEAEIPDIDKEEPEQAESEKQEPEQTVDPNHDKKESEQSDLEKQGKVEEVQPPGSSIGDPLPKTATRTFNLIVIGLCLILTGYVLFIIKRKKETIPDMYR